MRKCVSIPRFNDKNAFFRKYKIYFPRFQLYARAYERHASEDVLLWRPRNIGKKILQSLRFNVFADFCIKVLEFK